MKIHFIGIGGIGVSALAQYYLEKGHSISGSDLTPSEVTEFLKKRGVNILIGNQPENITADVEVVIYSPAVKPENPEFKKAKELGISLKSYPEALGELTHDHTTIAISGSHGKSTTTSMVALLLVKAGIDPTVIVGTKLAEFGNSNFRMGKSKYLVIEACEYDGSFLNYKPHITVVTNVDKEHLDYFKTFANVKKTFREFIMKLPKDGYLVANRDDKSAFVIASGASRGAAWQSRFFSLKNKESAKLKKILKVPGKHNISNALAALTVARILGVKDAISFASLSEFKGTWRRFEIVKTKPYTVISDYGHHPTEVMVTLVATREKFPKKKIWCIFQPHQYQRTFYLFKDFVALFKKAKIDQIIITDIYDVAGREEQSINKKVSAELLVKKIGKKSVQYMPMDQAEKFVKENVKNGEVVIVMGAGNIYKLATRI